MDKQLLFFSRSFLRYAIVKSRSTLEHVLSSLINNLYDGSIDLFDFVDSGTALIEAEIARQAYEAGRKLGIDVSVSGGGIDSGWIKDMTNEQIPYLMKLGDEITSAKLANLPIDPFLARIPMWGQLSDRAYNRALVELPKEIVVLRWRIGPTEQHCSTCFTLNEKIATAADWRTSGFVPRGDMLECGGFHCLCEWEVLGSEEVAALLANGWVSEVPVA